MQANLNALGLLACVIITASAIAFSPCQAPSRLRIATAILVAFLTFVASGILSVHMCDAGQPFTQMLVPSICLLLTLLIVKNSTVRRSIALALAVAAFVLSFQFSDIVHQNGFTGNPAAGARIRRAMIQSVNDRVVQRFPDNEEFPAGWFHDVMPPIVFEGDDVIKDYLERLNHLTFARHAWHTWFTGIYRVETIRADVWFNGGFPGASAAQLEVRPR